MQFDQLKRREFVTLLGSARSSRRGYMAPIGPNLEKGDPLWAPARR
jgi:hypothetical protein